MVSLFRATLIMMLIYSNPANAGLASALSCHTQPNSNETCKLLLIGAIDSVYAQENICADGETSYGLVIDIWKRALNKDVRLTEISTFESMYTIMLNNMGLTCS